VSSLAPGDLAVIVDDPAWTDTTRKTLGVHVVVIDGPTSCATDDPYWTPYWLVSGIPENILASQKSKDRGRISGRCLRKIPPAPMEREVPDLMEMVR
jgi:hypothetical protein